MVKKTKVLIVFLVFFALCIGMIILAKEAPNFVPPEWREVVVFVSYMIACASGVLAFIFLAERNKLVEPDE